MMEASFGHILLLPFPFQGHIMPFMEMANRLVDAGFTVTFANTDFNHRRLLAAGNGYADNELSSSGRRLRLLGIPDGLESDEERKNVARICQVIPGAMAAGVEGVIRSAADEGRPFRWILSDQLMSWAVPLGLREGLRAAVFWTSSAAMLAISLSIPKMIQIGLIAEDGLPKKHAVFQLAPGVPGLHTAQLAWNNAGSNLADKSCVFSFVLTNNRATADHAELLIFNSFEDLEPQALSLLPSPVPVGPLFSADHHPTGSLWPLENPSTILRWLDSHPVGSVLYIAFGSHTIFSEAQIEELARGLELTGRPFLWAVRPDLTAERRDAAFSPEYLKRIEGRGLLVGWAPQRRVLAHPSIGCFMSHCGWNSILEGLTAGVRFLCWPYFADQFLNETYICDTWKVGLSVGHREDGTGAGAGGGEMMLVKGEQIRKRVEEVMRDEEIGKRAHVWKERATQNVNPSGTCHENFNMVLNVLGSTP
ncbi:UDP-glycosyltransferase 83A1 [Platanthera zijinensis]|uniref:UDP-glycosyltransferase 83A1 n=1 Tax=Platanthera zijinensis TaxID=2320716 RepID=A0AAP0C139_9ASPA